MSGRLGARLLLLAFSFALVLLLGLIAVGPAAFAQSPPAVPTGFSLQGHGTTAALAWQAVPGAATYNLYRSSSAGGEGATPYRTGLPGSATAYTDTGLVPQNYDFYQITAVGPGGESAKSAEISVLPIVVPGPVAVHAGNTQITVSWPGGGYATGSRVYRATTPGGEGSTPYSTLPYSTTAFTDTGLTNGQTYYYRVTLLTATSESDRSAEVSGAPVPPPPLAPTGLNAAGGNAQMALTWTASAGATGYHVYRSGNPGAEQAPALATVTGTAYTDTGLTNGLPYCYVVTAFNAGGESAWSNETAQYAYGPCAVPGGVRAVPASGQVAVSWDNVPGAYTCTVYRAGSAGGPFAAVGSVYTYYSPGPDPSFGYVDTGVANGQTYYYYVTSVSFFSGLESAPSTTVSAAPKAAPAAPSGLSAQGVGTRINLSWPPVSGAASYNVYRGTWFGSEAVRPLATGLSGPAYTDTSAQLAPYSFYQVTAAGADGTEGARSPEAYAAALLPPPGFAAQAGNGQASLSWNLSPGNYRVYRGTAPGAETAVQDVYQGTYLDAGLTNGQTYYYQVSSTAYNSESARSGEISVTPGSALPGGVTGLSLSPGNNQVGLSWTAVSGATSYSVYRSTTTGGEGTTAFQPGLTGTSWTDASAANGTTYNYQMTAVNGSGEGARCPEQSATPVGPPGAPSYLSATATSASQIQLYWGTSSNAAGYSLERSPDGYTEWAAISTGAGTSFLDTGLPASTPYFYRVKATDGTGDSPYSTVAAATTLPSGAAVTSTVAAGVLWQVSGQNVRSALPVPYFSAPAPNVCDGPVGDLDTGYSQTGAITEFVLWDLGHPVNVGAYSTQFGNAGYVAAAYSSVDGSTWVPLPAPVSGFQQTLSSSGGNQSLPYVSARYVQFVLGTYPAPNLPAPFVTDTRLYDANGILILGPPPAAPAPLSAVAGNGQVSLSWGDPGSLGITYSVYQGTAPGGEDSGPVATGLTSPGYTATGLTNGTPYYFTVAASSSSGTSPASPEASATPVAIPASPLAAAVRYGVSAADGAPYDAADFPADAPYVYDYEIGDTSTGYAYYGDVSTSGSQATPVVSVLYDLGRAYSLSKLEVQALGFFDSGDGTGPIEPIVPIGPIEPIGPIVPTMPIVPIGDSGGGAGTSAYGGSGSGSWGYYGGSWGYAGGNSATPLQVFFSFDGVNWEGGGEISPGTTPLNIQARYVQVVGIGSGITGSTGAITDVRLYDEAGGLVLGPGQTPPAAPTGLAATAGNHYVSLTWNAIPSIYAVSYAVYRGTSAGNESPVPLAAGLYSPQFVDDTAVNGITYFYVVTLSDRRNARSLPSNEASATPQPVPPGAPLSLTASAQAGQNVLAWTAPPGPDLTYSVYRGTAAGGESPTPIASLLTAPGYADTSAVPATTYYYYVTASNPYGSGGPSNEASCTTALPAPTNLAVTGNAGPVTLAWTASAGAVSYNLYRGTSPNQEGATPVLTGLTGTSATDPSAVVGTAYYYRLTAVNGSVESPPSNEATTAPTVLYAYASPSFVSGASTSLIVVGTDGGGESGLTYTWDNWWTPPVPVAFSAGNGTNAGKNTTATFSAPGLYGFRVTLRNGVGLTATGYATCAVGSNPQALTVTPSSASVSAGGTQQFGVVVLDQFGLPPPIPPSVVWSVSGGGSISPAGLFTASPSASGAFTVTATSGNFTATATVTVAAATLTGLTATAASASQISLAWDPTTGATGYTVGRSLTSGGPYTPIASGITATAFGDAGLTAGTPYFYVVTASVGGGTSAPSNEAMAVPYASATLPAAAASYGYTDDGLRAWKTVGGQTTYFLYDGGVPLCELDGNGNVLATNTWGASGLLSRRVGPSSTFYAFDPSGNVAHRLDGAGNVLGSYVFDAFGGRTGTDNSADPYSWFGGQFGGYTDAETGLTLLSHRYYDSGTGRFLTRDPLGYAGGSNLYAYAGNNPIMWADPSGFCPGGDAGGSPLLDDAGHPLSNPGMAPNHNAQYMMNGVIKTGETLPFLMAAGPAGDALLDSIDTAVISGALGKFWNGLRGKGSPEPLAPGEPVMPGCPPLCFAAGTPVQMADGTTKPIERVQVGDRVRSRDPKTGQEGAKTVTLTIKRLASAVVTVRLKDAKTGQAETLTCTPEHPLFVQGQGWVEAGSLGIGSSIVSRAGPAMTVAGVTWKRNRGAGKTAGSGPSGFTVYNLTVEDDHTYFVGSIGGGTWVHNSCADDVASSAKRPASPQGNVSAGVKKLQRRQGDRSSLGLFNGIKLNDDGVENLIQAIFNDAQSTKQGTIGLPGPFQGNTGVVVFDSLGRGVLYDQSTNTFITFLEVGRGTSTVFN